MPVIPQEPHIPTDEFRKLVESTSGLGLPHEQIAILVGIDDKTLRKYYRTELDMGKAKANGQIAKTLFSKAIGGDTTSLIWWTKAQMRWSETVKQELTGEDGAPLLSSIQVSFVPPKDVGETA
jgi:hypothetical protein